MHDLKKKSTVLPLLDFLENAINIEYTFRQVATESDFNYYIDHLQQPSYKAYDLIYLCFHGQKKCICFADKTDLALMAFAVEEGIISGGGSAYIHASKEVAKLAETLSGDEKTGANVVLKALEAPLFHIAANAGLEGAVIINKVYESEPGIGFNALTEEYVDMVKDGILDPAKVTRSALQNATSVASTFLTTESVVADIKEPVPPMPAGNPGMGMM